MLDALESRLAVLDRAQHTVTLGVSTGAVTQAEQSVSSLGAAHQALNKTSTLGMDFSQVTAARSAAQGLDGDIVRLGTSLAGLAAPAALAAGLGLTTKAASDLNTEFSQLQANTTLTNAQMDQVSASIKQLASTTPTGVQQLSDAFRVATNEGFNVADAMKLVTAANESAISTGARTADVLSALAIAMHDFHIPATQAGEAMNVLHLAAAEGNVTLEEFASNSAKVWADAGKLGVAFTDAAGALSALTQSGYSAAQASTMLDGLMQKIIAPTAASRAEIEQLSRATGVDLVTDFTQAGIAARGLPQVLMDIQVATRGNVTEMEKLIPAMRGGRGEIALTSAAGIDFKGVLGDLSDTMAGKTNPTADSFARAMGLTSSQMGVFLNQLRLAAADMGQTFVPAASDVLKVLDSLGGAPEKALIGFGLLAAAIKTVSVAGELVMGTAARVGVALDAEAVAATADAAAFDKLTVARTASNLALAAGLAYGAQQLDQAIISPDVKDLAARQLQDINKSISNGQSTLDQQIAAQQQVAAGMKKADDKGPLGLPNPNIPGVGRPFPTGLTPVGEAGSNGYSDTQIQAQQEVIRQLQARKVAQDALTASVRQTNSAEAASPAASMRSPADQYASDLDYSKQAAADAKTAVANQAAYEKQMSADILASQKAGDAEALKSRNQANTDAAKVAKDAAQEAGAAQVAAATASADAWKAANAEIGKVDISQGLLAFANAAPGLDKVRDDLAAIGESDGALSGVAALADTFNQVYQEIDKASAALTGYNLTLDQTNKAMQEVGSLKGEYMAALDAAQKRAANGTADASDMQIIAMRSSVLGNLAQQTTKLQQAGNQDIIGKLTNLPDYAALDQHLRSIVASNGGGAGIIARVNLDKTTAEADLTRFEQQDRAAIVKIKADTTDATQAIDTYLQHINALPLDRTVTIHTNIAPQDAPGSTSAAQGNEGNGSAPPSSASGTMTPRGDASNLRPFAGDITQAAQQYGVPAWLLGAIIEHESGGVPGAVQPGGLGRGLTQVDIGQNPGYDEKRLTGTGPDDIKYQINAGAQILAAMIQKYGVDQGTQNYAGPAYQSQAGGGVPAGLRLPDELRQYYEGAVAQAIMPYSTSAAGGIGAPITRAQGYGPGDTGLGSGQTPSGGLAPGVATDSARQAIVDAAMADKGIAAFVDECERWVEMKVQAATGQRGATNTNEASATAAFNDAQRMGLVRPANQAPQAGDLVYYPDPNGGAGHVAIYVGGGQQVSTWDKGDPSNPTDAAIHQESIAPGARFVMVPGTESDTTNRSNTPDPRQGFPAAAGTPPPNINGTTGGTPTPPPIPPDFSKAAEDLSVALAKLDPAALKDVGQQFTNILPALTKMQENTISADPANLTGTDKQNALNAAIQQGLQYETDYANLVRDVENHTGNIAADTAKIAADVGGPMADGYAKAALASAQLAASQDQITTLQDQQKTADLAQQQVVAARAAADQAESRRQTLAGWAQQDAGAAMQARQTAASNRLADKGTAENDRYTQVQRDEQDRQRQLQFSQQVQATDLQNKLTDLQKSQQSTVYQRTGAEQALAGETAMAGTNAEAATLAARNASMHEQDTAQKDLNTKAIDDIQLQIREQARAANLESYNLESETIQRQRQHENIMTGLSAQSTAQQRTFAAEQLAESQHQQAIARSTQLQQWQEQDARQAEDARYNAEKAANTAAQQAQTAIGRTAQASLDTANQALAVWQQTGAVVAIAAGQAGAAANNYAANPTYTRTLGTHAAGGAVSGWGIVGDSPSGDMSSAEAVFGTYTVVPHDQSVRAGLVSGGGGGAKSPMTVNLNIGDLALAISDEDRAELTALMERIAAKAAKAGVGRGVAVGIRPGYN